ncbi:DUF6753 family protein [Aeromonas caviae]|jgi:hypothetical protein
MSDLDDSFAKLLGRQPNDKERQDLYRVRDALGLKSNDAIWLVLMALQHYQTQYEKIPMAVKAASTAALNDFATGAENALEGVKQQTISDLSVAVGKAAQKIAGDTASAQKWKWVSICMVSVTMIVGGLSWGMHYLGQHAGYGQGYSAGYNVAKNEVAAAAWANTPEGKMAYRFAQGDLQMVARCNAEGWKIKNGVCFPYASDNQIRGWAVP